MFENLTESAQVRERAMTSSLLSLGCHVVCVAVAVVATRSAVEATTASPRLPDRPYLHVPAAKTAPRRVTRVEVPDHAPPRLEVVAVPTIVPLGLPAVPADGPQATSMRQLLGMPDHDPFTPEGTPLYGTRRDSVLPDAAVDEPVQWLSGPRPEYPGALRAAGVEGVVALRMIVDTTGRVEAASVVVLHSTHTGFEQAAIAAVRQARFVPARLAGRPVRQLVQQSVRFSLEW